MKNKILLLAFFIVSPCTYAKNECNALPAISNNQTLVGWITYERTTTQWIAGSDKSVTTSLGAFRSVAVIENNQIKETVGSSISNGQKFWSIENTNKPTILTKVDGFMDHMNTDHCVYFATLNKNDYPLWTLLTSKPDSRFRKPNSTEIELFYNHNTTCVNQGDYPVGKEPPCKKPKLLAISDINKNNHFEYWASQPYMWDDGLTVWEYDGKELKALLNVCTGCSD